MFQRGWNHQPEQIVGGERCLPWELGTAVLDRHLHQPWSRRWWKGRMARRHPMLGFPGRYPEWTKKGNVTRIWQEAYLWNPLKQFICRFFPFFFFWAFPLAQKRGTEATLFLRGRCFSWHCPTGRFFDVAWRLFRNPFPGFPGYIMIIYKDHVMLFFFSWTIVYHENVMIIIM